MQPAVREATLQILEAVRQHELMLLEAWSNVELRKLLGAATGVGDTGESSNVACYSDKEGDAVDQLHWEGHTRGTKGREVRDLSRYSCLTVR